jgi:hypothetical protein
VTHVTHLDPSWTILASYETQEHNRCVDIFARPDGTYGFEEFRRDPEDMGTWYDVAYFAEHRYDSRAEAEAAARRQVHWLTDQPA